MIPYRLRGGKVSILLVTARNNKKKWLLPQGFIDPGLSAAASAEKEAFEEAGILGEVETKAVGYYLREKKNYYCRVGVFPLEVAKVLKNWPERKARERGWFSPEEAAKLCRDEEVRRILKKFNKVIQKSQGRN